MGETTFETQWEWLNGKSKSEVVRETQLKWLEAEDGSMIRVDSVVAIYPKTTIPPSIHIQAGNCSYRFKEYSCDLDIDEVKKITRIMRNDINNLKNIIQKDAWTSDTLKASDI